jgi:dipeptidyl aminopeptidase/acylaminoacyl peptidase
MRIASSHRATGLLLLLAVSPAWATPTLADYGNLPTTAMLKVSPSGNSVAFRRTGDGFDLVMVVSLEKQEVIRKADVSAVVPNRMFFISEDELVLVASEYRHLRGYRDSFDVSTAFVLDIPTGEIRQLLTPGDQIYVGQSGLGRIVGMSSDRRYLYMPAIGSDKWTRGSLALNLMKVNIESPRRPKVFQQGNYGTIDFFASPSDRILAIVTYNNKSDHHQVLAHHDKNWDVIFDQTAAIMNVGFVGVTPDQQSLVMLEENPQTGRTAYSALSLADGSVTSNLFARDDADVESVLTDINRIAYGIRYSGFTPRYRFFDPARDRRIEDIQAMFPDQSVWLSDWSDDWKHIVVYVEGASFAGTYYLFSDGMEPQPLATARPNIKSDDIHPIIRMDITARDGLIIPTLLTVPKAKVESPRQLPAVLLPHGGPQAYDRIGFDWLAQAFASQGYVVIQPQFRGSDGFGAAFIRAGHGEWGGKMQDDLADSLQFLVDGGVVDPDRVCIVGGSYGGYAALAGGAFTPELYRCVVSLNGVSDLPGMLAYERHRGGKKSWVVSYFENFMVKGEATKDKLRSISPVRHAKSFTAPVLLIHGENDQTVPFEQSDDMYDKLRAAGKDVQLIKLEDDNHHLVVSENRLASLEAMINFVNQHIGDESLSGSLAE